MIIVRSPLRITLGGGGTDLPSYYLSHGGFVLAAAIDKYVYVTINESFRHKISLKYSKIEDVDTPNEVEHPVIREALKLLQIDGSVDIDTISDIPAGTGMGSSGSFTVGLLLALHAFKRESVTREELGEQAFHIEHDILGQHCGKQDPYIAALGGIKGLSFIKSIRVIHSSLQIQNETLASLEDGLLLFFTGYTRAASDILADQDIKSQNHDQEMLRNMDFTKKLGLASEKALEDGDLHLFAAQMHQHWLRKKERSIGISNKRIDDLYQLAIDNGALGGKLVGAGGGGFLMFYTEEKRKLRNAMLAAGLREVRVRFDFQGATIL